MRQGEITNAECGDGQLRTRRLHFPHVATTIPPWHFLLQNVPFGVIYHIKLILSLHSAHEFNIAIHWFSNDINFKRVFCLLGSQVPQNQKERLRERLFVKILDKQKVTSVKTPTEKCADKHKKYRHSTRITFIFSSFTSQFSLFFISLWRIMCKPCNTR